MTQARGEKRPLENIPEGMAEEDRRELRPALEALAAWARDVAERPESFWERQRAAVWTRLAARRRQKLQRLGAVAAAVCLLLAALALVGVNRHPARTPPRAQTDQDRELLFRVEQTMQSDGPQALEPAALLVQQTRAETNANRTERETSEGENQ
jgi:hypothetical protein